MRRQTASLSFLGLIALTGVGCGGGGGGSATPTREQLTGGSSKVWKVSLIDATRNFSGGDDDRHTYTACPNRYTRTADTVAWECGATDTITFNENGTVQYQAGAAPATGSWTLSGSMLSIAFGGSQGTITDRVEVLNSGRLVLRRVNRVASGATQTTEAGSAYVIVNP